MNEFLAGFGRCDITPEGPTRINSSRVSDHVLDPLYITCVAVSDGENTALMMTVDVRNVYTHITEPGFAAISEATGVPQSHIFLTATHNHSAPDISNLNDESIQRYLADIFFPRLTRCAKEALQDLSSATLSVAAGETEPMNHVRRIQLADGSWKGPNTANKSTADRVRHESEADHQLRLIRFHRETGKDIVMANWQAHATRTASTDRLAISADYVGACRSLVEQQKNVLFAYYQGAAGNVNFVTRIPGRLRYIEHTEIGKSLSNTVSGLLENAKPVKSGAVQIKNFGYTATVDHGRRHLFDAAMQIHLEKDPDKRQQLLDANGIASGYEACAIIRRQELDSTNVIPLSAVCFGDVGIAFTPQEMFDTNGMQLRAASPFKMTFSCAYTNGSFSYMPSAAAFPHGEYEVFQCDYVPGTGESCALELARLLNEAKKEQDA